jgi:hypothetical protein
MKLAIDQISSNNHAPEPIQATNVANPETEATTKTEQMPARKAKSDTITISKQATQMAQQLYSPQEEAKETPIQKETEAVQGRK